MAEQIIETKKCKNCWINFDITNTDKEFYDKISPVFGWKKFAIPTPTLCPDCRQKRRLCFRNERKLYRRNCDASGKQIISVYSPDKPYKVYDHKIWRSDQWNPIDYGQEYDFSKTFFGQFDELMKKIPQIALINFGSENSDYCNRVESCKDDYLCFGAGNAQNCMYSYWLSSAQDIVDSCYCFNSSDIYAGIDCDKVTLSMYVKNCLDCSECVACYNCKWCTHCIGCTNQNNQSYMIFNTQYTKEEFYKKKESLTLDTLLHEFHKILIKTPRIQCDIVHSEQCTWDGIINGKNLINCFNVQWWENCKRVTASEEAYNSQDTSYAWWLPIGVEYCYELMWGQDYRHCLFSNTGVGLVHVLYSIDCKNSSHLFGCVWLHNKEYCILNKQYTKEEYEMVVWKIIEHMQTTKERWEFFPSSISPFGYNETVVQEYFPLTRDEALAQWYKRMDQEYPINIPENAQTVKAQDIPANIQDITDDILNKVIICEVSGRPFRIIKPELDFYRKHDIALPRKHPDIRHQERQGERSPRELHLRTCDHCGSAMVSIYSSEYVWRVYCETCYNKEMYG